MVGGRRLQHSLPEMALLAGPLTTQELSEFYMLPGVFFNTAAVGNTAGSRASALVEPEIGYINGSCLVLYPTVRKLGAAGAPGYTLDASCKPSATSLEDPAERESLGSYSWVTQRASSQCQCLEFLFSFRFELDRTWITEA